jgi:hypothetical protein
VNPLDESSSRAIADTLGALYRDLHEKLRQQVRDLDSGTLNWKPLPLANSIAVLVVHTVGSERSVIRALRSLATERDRDAEFKAEAEASDLLTLLDGADRELDEQLDSITPSDLTEHRAWGDRPPRRGLEWLVSNYGHAREHLAQIELTKQLYDSRS